MRDIQRCKNQIYSLYEQDPSQIHNFRDLTTTAWGSDGKPFCLDAFGSVNAVRQFLLNPGNIELFKQEEDNLQDTHSAAPETGSADEEQLQTTQEELLNLNYLQAEAIGRAKVL